MAVVIEGQPCGGSSWSHLGHALIIISLTWLICLIPQLDAEAVTEGDTGYDYRDYGDAYEDTEFEEASVIGVDPSFDVPILNVTVVAGQTAVLPCSIDNLHKHKVVWLDSQSTPLTYEDRRVVDDSRFSIVRPYVKEWNLQIREVKWEDQDQYRCSINTTPVRSKTVSLHVKVPAQIIDELSSDDVTVEEGDTVVLVCNVTGVPRPEVSWFRRTAESKLDNKERKKCDQPRSLNQPGQEIGMTGEMIIISNVSRYCDDIYECVASNGVPPAVSRKIRVTVEFAPEISMPNSRISQMLGKDTILECIITAYPQTYSAWKKNGEPITTSTNKYRIEAFEEEGDNMWTLSLRIHNIEPQDYGEYVCEAANEHGKVQKSTYLDQMKVPSQPIRRPVSPDRDMSIVIPRYTPSTIPGKSGPPEPGYNPIYEGGKFPVGQPSTDNQQERDKGRASSRKTNNGCQGNNKLTLSTVWLLSTVTVLFLWLPFHT